METTTARPHQDAVTISRCFRILVGGLPNVNAIAERFGVEPTKTRTIAIGVCERGGPAYDLADLIEAFGRSYPNAGEQLVAMLQDLLDSLDIQAQDDARTSRSSPEATEERHV